jgi:KaiC/GvpD/RAD55 family RecA-like ATPase
VSSLPVSPCPDEPPDRCSASPQLGRERSPIRFLDVSDMVATPPPPVSWLAHSVLPRGALTALYAPGGDGKSLFSMALSAAVARGDSLAGIHSEEGTVVYLDAENGEREIHRRVHTLGLPTSGVHVADASRLDLRLDMPHVEAVVGDTSPDLLVLDSLRSMTPGMDENDTSQTARALDPLRRLAHESRVAILLIHHANKGGRDFRGASSIRDAVDVLWHLGREEGDPDQRRRFLHNRKMRVAPDGERLWLQLAVDRGRILIDQADPFDRGRLAVARPTSAQLSDEILAGMGAQPLPLADIARMVGRSPKDGSVRNALGALKDAGLIVRDGDRYTRVQGASPRGGGGPLHLPPGVHDSGSGPRRINEGPGGDPR